MNGHNPEGNELQRSVSKQVAVRELRRIQELTMARIEDPEVSDKTLYELGRSYVVLREAIRIEKGIIKPGSRNVSVRELSAAEQRKRIGPRASRPTDYLRDAEATLARAQAASQPPTEPK